MTRRAPFVVAIDGPAASGKGTIARRLAAAYGWPHMDTGLLYRAVGWKGRRQGVDLADPAAATAVARGLADADLADPSLRGDAAAEAGSQVAVHAAVRAELLARQRRFAERPGGAILDGRDIASVVVPGADVKLFVTASPEARARRRWAELSKAGGNLTLEETLADIRRRDARDADRAAAPLVAAPGAVLLDTTDLDIDRAFDAARGIVEAARAERDRKAQRASAEIVAVMLELAPDEPMPDVEKTGDKWPTTKA